MGPSHTAATARIYFRIHPTESFASASPTKVRAMLTLSGHTDSVRDVAAANKNVLITGSYDKTVKVWHLDAPETPARTAPCAGVRETCECEPY